MGEVALHVRLGRGGTACEILDGLRVTACEILDGRGGTAWEILDGRGGTGACFFSEFRRFCPDNQCSSIDARLTVAAPLRCAAP
jgi:hypothetical protein